MNFQQYLNEAFNPKPINFGTDEEMKNGQFIDTSGFIYTFFEFNDLYYIIIFDTLANNLAFKFSKTKSLKPKDYSYLKTEDNKALKIFNFVMFIFLKILQKYKPNDFQFCGASKDGTDNRLERFYAKLIQYPEIIKLTKLAGYEFNKTVGKTHQFKKIGFVGKLKDIKLRK